MFGKKT